MNGLQYVKYELGGKDYEGIDNNSITENYYSELNGKTPKFRFFIRPFRESGLSSWSYLVSEIKRLSEEHRAQQTIVLIVINLIITLILLSLCQSTKSMALLAYTYLSWFSLLSLVTCLVCVWVETRKASLTFTFGLVRCEALLVFASVMLCMFGSLFIIKESLERLMEPEEINTSVLSIGGFIGLVLHLGMTAFAHNPPLTHVVKASKSSLLQEHFAHACHSVCVHLPSLNSVLMPRVNPLALISMAGFVTIIFDHIIIQVYNYQRADTIAALLLALLTMMTMYPLCVCSAKLLLQTIPSHLMAQLDKCLHEALTLDGVLEFRNENFWSLGPASANGDSAAGVNITKGTILAGSLHVRIRRDANEQLVLAHVKERLSPIVSLLTIQVFKDDWTRGSTTLQLLKNSAHASSLSPSHYADYVNISYSPIFPSHDSNTYPVSYSIRNNPVRQSPSLRNQSESPYRDAESPLPTALPPQTIPFDNVSNNIEGRLPLLDRNLGSYDKNKQKSSPYYVNIDLPYKVDTSKISTKSNCNETIKHIPPIDSLR